MDTERIFNWSKQEELDKVKELMRSKITPLKGSRHAKIQSQTEGIIQGKKIIQTVSKQVKIDLKQPTTSDKRSNSSDNTDMSELRQQISIEHLVTSRRTQKRTIIAPQNTLTL